MSKIIKEQSKKSKENSKIKPGDLKNVSGGGRSPNFPKRKPPKLTTR